MNYVTYIRLFFFIVVSGSIFPAAAAAPQFPTPSGYVNDFAHVFSSETAQKLAAILTEVEKNTRIEFHVVTLPSLKGKTIQDTTPALFKEWKIGKPGENNGILFLLAPKEQGVRIEAGSLFQPILSKPDVGTALQGAMAESFGRQQYGEGMFQGTRVLLETLDRELHLRLNVPRLFSAGSKKS